MRSRQAPALDLTGEEIASSNTTLNTLLGGRQKSWMTGASSSVRPTPRDPMRQRPSLSILPSSAPSGEPSPVFPYPQEHTQLEANRIENQFPQPDGPHQSAAQPTTSLSIRDNPQRPQMQTTYGYSHAHAQLSEAQQASLLRVQTIAQLFADIPSFHSQLQLIEDHVHQNGGLDALDSATERHRYSLLREACANGDLFFVVLHQLFCLWTTDPPMVARIDGFHDVMFTSNAFRLIANLIRPNDEIGKMHLEWFAKFPTPFQDPMARSDHYRRMLVTVTASLVKLSSDNDSFLRVCLQRRYPPLVDEMVCRIGLTSPTLQTVFFTASMLSLGVPDDIGCQLRNIFRQDREDCRALTARFNTSVPLFEKEIIDRNQRIVQSYLAIQNGQGDAALPPMQSFASGPNQNPTTTPRQFISHSPIAQAYLAMQIGQGDAALQAPPPMQSFANGPNQNPTTTPRQFISHSPIAQTYPAMQNGQGDAALQASPPMQSFADGPNNNRTTTPRHSISQSPVAQTYLAMRSGQGDASLQAVPPVQPFASGSSQTPTTTPRHSVSLGPVAQQFHSAVSLPHQSPVNATFRPASESPVVSQFPFQVGDSLQTTDRGGRFHIPNHQSVQTSQANSAVNNHPTAGQAYSNGQNATMAQVSHVPFANQFTANPSQYPQQRVANNTTQISALRSSYNSNQPGRSMANNYPGVVATPQAQPNLYQRQHYTVRQQNSPPQLPDRTNQFVAQQAVAHRQNNAVATEHNVSNPQRTYRGSRPTTQGSVSGAPPLSAPTPPTAVNPNSWQSNRNLKMKPLPLIPPQGQILPAYPPNPEVNAVHHSYLRSPYLVPRDTLSESAGEGCGGRYYQAVKEFALGPAILSRNLTLSTFEFNVPDVNFARIAKDKAMNVGSPVAREVHRGTLQYRMRCILAEHDDVIKAVDCAVADTVWPATIFMELNGVIMDVRRKLFHGKDLPVDITHFILKETKNQVKVSVPRPRKSRKDLDYIFVVEVVEVFQHQQILNMCLQKQRTPAHVTTDNIKQSLSASLVDDDDISMVAGDLTINLADPFMARIFDIPVRGSSCLHRECFDLVTFLLTRNSKPKLPYQISMVDVWKCPLCSKDARPYSLRVDDFLVSVRESLARQNIIHTKTIIVAADGSWKPKPEELSVKRSASHAGFDDADDSEEDGRKLKSPTTNKFKEMEIIVLDDD